MNPGKHLQILSRPPEPKHKIAHTFPHLGEGMLSNVFKTTSLI